MIAIMNNEVTAPCGTYATSTQIEKVLAMIEAQTYWQRKLNTAIRNGLARSKAVRAQRCIDSKDLELLEGILGGDQ